MARPSPTNGEGKQLALERHDNPPTLNLASISEANFIEMNYDNGAEYKLIARARD